MLARYKGKLDDVENSYTILLTGRCVWEFIKSLLATINYMFTTQFLPPNKALQKSILQPKVLLQCISAAQLSIIASFTGFTLWFYFLFSHPHTVWKSKRVDTKRKQLLQEFTPHLACTTLGSVT